MSLIAVSVAILRLATAPRADTPDPTVATPIEQAVIEYRCSRDAATSAQNEAANRTCLNAQLTTLRSDFGRDLSRLSGAARRTIDAACRQARESSGRDAYVACLSIQLAGQVRAPRSAPAPAPDAAPVVPPANAASVDSAATAAHSASWRLYGLWLGGGLIGVGAAAAAVVTRKKRTRTATSSRCRACSVEMAGLADLCERCRHEAADAVRRAAAAERVQREHAPAKNPAIERPPTPRAPHA